MTFTIKNLFKVSTIIMCIMACNISNLNNKEPNLENNLSISDFENMYGRKFKLKDSSKVKPIKDISKILFYESISMRTYNNFAVDFTRKKMQKDPDTLHLSGFTEFEIDLSEDDIHFLFNLLEKSKIIVWKRRYNENDKYLLDSGEGYLWELAIQYNDGTTWYYSGHSYPKRPVLPEGYNTLVEGLNALAERKSAASK